MTVVVTGAAGHIGGNVVRALLGAELEVRALVHRDTRAVAGLGVEQVSGDLLDVDSLVKAFRGARCVHHLAARIELSDTDAEAVHAVNVEGTRNVVAACRKAGVERLVHYSSVHALQQAPLERPLDETRPLADVGPCSLYDRTKAQAEREVRAGIAAGMDAVIVYPPAVIGPYDYKPSRTGEMLLAMLGWRLPGLVKAGFVWADVRDVAAGGVLAQERGRAGEGYLLGGEYATLLDVSRMVHELTGARTPTAELPWWLARLAAPFGETWCRLRDKRPLLSRAALDVLAGSARVDGQKAERELGYRVRPLKETVADTLAWFDDNGEGA